MQENIHIYFAIKRKKDNEGLQYEYVIRKPSYITTSALIELREQVKFKKGIWRIYRTVNRRSVKKAMRLMINELIDKELVKVDSKWTSILMKKVCRAEKNFLFDCDEYNEQEFKSLLSKFPQEHIVEYTKTPNGYHLVTKPFDIRKVDDIQKGLPMFDLKFDEYIFIEMYKDGKIVTPCA